MTIALTRRGFLQMLGVGATIAAVPALVEEPRRKIWQVGRGAPVGERVELYRSEVDGLILAHIHDHMQVWLSGDHGFTHSLNDRAFSLNSPDRVCSEHPLYLTRPIVTAHIAGIMADAPGPSHG